MTRQEQTRMMLVVVTAIFLADAVVLAIFLAVIA